MIKAVEASEKAKAYEVKTIAGSRARAIAWLEEEVAPIIQAEAEKGMRFIIVRVPNDVECVYVKDYLREHGYGTEHHSCCYYRIMW